MADVSWGTLSMGIIREEPHCLKRLAIRESARQSKG
jgi:hypothetical protein